MKRVNLTKTVIRALQEGETIADTEINELYVRCGKTVKTFFWRRRVMDAPVRRNLGRVSDMSIMEARSQAQELNRRLLATGTIEEPKPEEPEASPTIKEALSEALDNSRRGELGRLEWWGQSKHFLDWLAQEHPGVNLWQDLTRAMARGYVSYLVKRGLAHNSIRLYLAPIKQTARFYGLEYSETFSNFTEGLRLGGKQKKGTPTVLVRDVMAFSRTCGALHRHLYPGVILSGLCGLRLTEALRIKWKNIDFENGLIEVTGEVKNQYSTRVIPICTTAIEALRDIRMEQAKAKVKDPAGYVVQAARGIRIHDAYSCALRKVIKAWLPESGWNPKDLRNCIPTWGALSGRGGPMLEQYLGHAPNDVTGLHYVARMNQVLPGEKELLLENMSKLRRIICEPFQAEIDRILSEEQTALESKPMD